MFLVIIIHALGLTSFPCILIIVHLSLLVYLMHAMFIISYLSIAQHVVDSIPWCADILGYYYKEQASEEVPKDLHSADEERVWRANDIEWHHHSRHERDAHGIPLELSLFTYYSWLEPFYLLILFNFQMV